MQSMPRLLAPLLALSLSLGVSACASKGPPLIAYPPAADLVAPAKPQLSAEAVEKEDAVALALHDSAVESWGDGMALQIARLCRWATANGMKGVTCPASR